MIRVVKALVSCLFGGEEQKHAGRLYSCRWSRQNGMCLLALCVRERTPRLLGGNIGVVGYALQWAPRRCQDAHCSVGLPREVFVNTFSLTCSLHHSASKCPLNLSKRSTNWASLFLSCKAVKKPIKPREAGSIGHGGKMPRLPANTWKVFTGPRTGAQQFQLFATCLRHRI